LLLSYTSTFPIPLFNFLALLSKKEFSLIAVPLPHLFIYPSLSLSTLELPNLFISSINYLTFLSIFFSLSSLELPNLFISPINYTPPIFYLNPVL
jgi:hypothetical protein